MPKASTKKPTVFIIPIPKTVKVGDQFTTTVENKFADKTFPKGSKVTYLGVSKKKDFGTYFVIWPQFQFADDAHTHRILEFKELKKVTKR